MIRNRAKKYGERTAFRFREAGNANYTEWSWNRVSDTVSQVAFSLLRMGYSQGSNIGIFSDNKPWWTFADLGIMAVRAVVVPFYSTSTKPQLKYIIDETGMELLLAGNREQAERASSLLDGSSCLKTIVCLFDDLPAGGDPRILGWSAFLALGNELPEKPDLVQLTASAPADELATIIYTSGTTGEPKGVMLGQDNFMNCIRNHDQRLTVTESDVSLCFLPLSHIFERSWTFYLLHRGAVNVFLENPKNVIEELPKARPSLMCTVPRFFEKTYDGILKERSHWPSAKQAIFDWAINTGHEYCQFRKDNKSAPLMLQLRRSVAEVLVYRTLRKVFGGNIRFMPCAGAALRPEILKFFHAAGLFINYGYGATETTATVSCFREDVYEFEATGTVMPGTQVRISQPGEIMIKGGTVFKGYYKKPNETARVLVDGWYYSGDYGSFTPDGNLLMTDRINDIFKTSGGKYVSPQKVEMALGKEPCVEQVIVFGDNQKFITALIVPSYERLRSELPEFSALPDKEIAGKKEVYDFMAGRFDALQADLEPYEKVIKFSLLAEPFTIENGGLTSTLKVRRKIISQQYAGLIDSMYRS